MLFSVWVWGLGVWALGLRFFRVWGVGFRVLFGLGFRVWGLGCFWVSNSGSMVGGFWGLHFLV